uniref:Succinate dehydrogenase subunit 4 n=1 Tax=Erythrocystis saccata TaxID=2822695 RepID=A0A8E6L1W9_9FLOR|nr:succinate dehydrogenase subunit 4 [Erythrocystis saccata]
MYYKFLRYFFVVFLLISFILDFELFWIILNYFNIHLYLGIKSILKDYIHYNKLKVLLLFFVRLFLVFTFNLVLEIIF